MWWVDDGLRVRLKTKRQPRRPLERENVCFRLGWWAAFSYEDQGSLPLSAGLSLTTGAITLVGAPSMRVLLVLALLAFRIERQATLVALELIRLLFVLLHCNLLPSDAQNEE